MFVGNILAHDMGSGGSKKRKKSSVSSNRGRGGSDGGGRRNGNDKGPPKGDEKEVKRIWIYRNGVELDEGFPVTLNKRIFRNWISFLDYVTEKAQLKEGVVHKIFTPDGQEARHFFDLMDLGEYVAVHARFIPGTYGRNQPRKWNNNRDIPVHNPKPLDSDESKQIYLYTRDFRPSKSDIWGDKNKSFDLKRHGGRKKYEEEQRKQIEKERKEWEKQREKERKDEEKRWKEEEQEREREEREDRRKAEQKEKERQKVMEERRKEGEQRLKEEEKERERWEKAREERRKQLLAQRERDEREREKWERKRGNRRSQSARSSRY